MSEESHGSNGWGISNVDGGGRDKLVEPSLTVCEIFETAWKPPIIDRDKAISLYKSGTSKRAIAKKLGIARATVTRIIQTVDT